MASIWEASVKIQQQVRAIADQHHSHLHQASLWVLCSDARAIRDNHIIATQTKKCTNTERLSSGHDFKIIIMMEIWAMLTDEQRDKALDEALCRCGVKRVPQTMEINGKKEVVKDDYGRIVYTDEIAYDKEDRPKWKINRPDAELYFGMIRRHADYNEEAENVQRAFAGQELKLPEAAADAAMVDAELEEAAL
jgi:hypothetical protein